MNIFPLRNFSFTSNVINKASDYNFKRQPEWYEKNAIRMQNVATSKGKRISSGVQNVALLETVEDVARRESFERAENLKEGADLFLETANVKYKEFQDFIKTSENVVFYRNGHVAMKAVECDDDSFDKIIIKYNKEGYEISRAKIKKDDEGYKMLIIEEDPLSTKKNIYEFFNGNVELISIGISPCKTDLIFGYAESGFPLFAIESFLKIDDENSMYAFKCDFKNNRPIAASEIASNIYKYNGMKPQYNSYYF